MTDTYKVEYAWNYYKYYAEDKSSVYIFSERGIYEAFYVSITDIGIENFENLCAKTRLKLTSINKAGKL